MARSLLLTNLHLAGATNLDHSNTTWTKQHQQVQRQHVELRQAFFSQTSTSLGPPIDHGDATWI
jgi:hypothetical protein